MSTTPTERRTHILRPDCPECGKAALQESFFHATLPKFVNGNLEKQRKKFIKLTCGHTLTEDQAESVSFADIVSDSGKTLRPYQEEACERLVKRGFRNLLRIDVGLGKTIISLSIIRKYWKELGPILIVCKSSMTVQWLMEWLEWVPNRLVQVISTGKEKPEKGFKAIIISMDLIRTVDWLEDFAPKTVIFDEIQHVKNPEAKRTKVIQDLVAKAQYFIPLSGTPIKNHVGEYFNVLNMLDPRSFRIREQFIQDFVSYYHTDSGYLKLGGVRKDRYEEFRRKLDPLLIDYKKVDVAKDLPAVMRDYKYFNLEKDDEKAYRKEMLNFLEANDNAEAASGRDRFAAKQEVNQSLMRMRQIVGIAKVPPVVDYTLDWLDDEDEEREIFRSGNTVIVAKPKIVLFIHHITVGTMLEQQLTPELQKRGLAPPIRLLGGISGLESAQIEQEFRDNPLRRVLIASTLASGEGKNFQFCANGVLCERQWNPPNEEQAEGRFPRPGSTADKVLMMYPVARRTVDEKLAKLVENKRCALLTTEGRWVNVNETTIMQELMALLVKERAEWKS